MTIYRNSYIINQSNGIRWKFFFKKGAGIIYQFLKENTWSEYYSLSKEALKNFSVFLRPNDSINVLYQDFNGTIMLNKFDGQQWSKQRILTNKEYEKFNIYFNTANIGKKIYIFFSIFDKEKKTASFFYQIFDEESNLSEPKIIDIVKHDYELPFALYSENDKQLSIIYQKFSGNHKLGYKLLDKASQKLSDFKLIDTSIYPFKDYFAVMFDENLHALYVKTEDNIDVLNYVNDSTLKLTNNKLFKNSNIGSCLISIIYNQIFCFWINNNKIYSSFSIDNGNTFSTPPYEQLISSQDVFKSIYLTNLSEDKESILGNEIYLINNDNLKHLAFSSFYSCIQNNDFLSYIKYYIINVYSKVVLYEKEFQQISKSNVNLVDLNNQLTQKINFLEKNLADKGEKLKTLEEIRIKKAEEKNALKNQLSKNIRLYQENLYDRENKITFLEKINKENQEEILQLKDKFSRNITLYQKSVTDKDTRINSLEKINREKEEEILQLKEKLSQDLLLLQENLDNKEKEIKSIKNINNEKEKEIGILKEKLSENERIILNLTRKIKTSNRY